MAHDFRGSFVALSALAFAAVSCSSSSTTTASNGTTTTSSATSTGSGGAPNRGPADLPIDGEPNGLYWDDAKATLLIADDGNNRILSWADGPGFGMVSALPMASANGAGLGQLVETSDGTIVVTRFGFGTNGDVAFVPPTGSPAVVPNLDPMKRRIGITVTSDGTLFDSWFLKQASGYVGSIGQLSLTAGTEPTVITGLQKPVGVLAVADKLYVSDQTLNQILVAPIATPATYTVFAELAGPDLLTAGPSGDLFSGSLTGEVYRIASTGTVSVFQSGLVATRGVAYDGTNKRLFVVEHDAAPDGTVTSFLHIFPVD